MKLGMPLMKQACSNCKLRIGLIGYAGGEEEMSPWLLLYQRQQDLNYIRVKLFSTLNLPFYVVLDVAVR